MGPRRRDLRRKTAASNSVPRIPWAPPPGQGRAEEEVSGVAAARARAPRIEPPARSADAARAGEVRTRVETAGARDLHRGREPADARVRRAGREWQAPGVARHAAAGP